MLIYFAAFPLVRSNLYTRSSQSQWGPRLDYAFDVEHQDADVLIYGDSSAFIGVDPRLVKAQLGWKTIVLPATIASLPITGELALQHYLKANKPPKLLVVYLSPWDMEYLHSQNIHKFEGEEMLFRHADLPSRLHFALRHPGETFLFPFRLYSTFSPAMLKALRKPVNNSETVIASAMGHFADTENFPPLTGACRIPKHLLEQTGTSDLEGLARRYSGQLPVMVYLSPMPACLNAGEFANRGVPSLGVKPAVTMPAQDFLADEGYAHVEPAYVPVSTQLFTDALRARLGTAPAGRPQSAR